MTDPTVLLTRPIHQSCQFLNDLTQRLGYVPKSLISPVTRIETTPLPQDLHGAQALLFTSANGVESLAAQTTLRDIPCYCVGPSTCAAAQNHGFRSENAQGTALDLLQLVQNLLSAQDGPIYHISGQNTAFDLAAELMIAGYDAQRVILYSQQPQPLTNQALTLLTQSPTIAPVFSPKTAERFLTYLQQNPIKALQCVCISESTATPLRKAGISVHIAPAPNRTAMLETIAALLAN